MNDKRIEWIKLSKDCDIDSVDDICWDYPEATLWYDENEVRFYGTTERLGQFLIDLQGIGEYTDKK